MSLPRLVFYVNTALILWGCGCRSLDPDAEDDFSALRGTVYRQSSFTPRWVRSDERAAVEQRVRDMLSEGVTLNEAVKIALLNNRRLQAAYEGLRLGRAAYVQAQLIKNPIFDASFKLIDGSGSHWIVEMAVMQDLLDVLLIPQRKKLAAIEMERIKAKLTTTVLDVIAQVKMAYRAHQAAVADRILYRRMMQAAEASYDMARRLREAGNVPVLAVSGEQALYEQSRLGLWQAELAVDLARESLLTQLGLLDTPKNWRVETGPPSIPDQEWSLIHLEAGALRNSQTLKQLQQRLEAAGVRMKLDITTRVLPELAGGAEAEREGDGTWAVGPVLAVGIPIFDFGQARRAAGMAQLRRWADLYTATTVETRAAVRAARQRLRNARSRARHLQEVVVPLAERITRQTQEQYNAMQVGVFSLLTAKQRELQVKRQQIAVRQEYWQVRAALERMANGGSLEGLAGMAFFDRGDTAMAAFETTEGH